MRKRIVAPGSLGIVLVPAILFGQPVASFDQLGSRVKVGNQVVVTDTEGRAVEGTLVRLTDRSLTVNAARDVTVEAGSVSVVAVRSKRVGAAAAWGAGIAAVVVGIGLGVSSEACTDCLSEEWGTVAAVGIGVGAGTGALVGALRRGRLSEVYRAPAGTTPRLRVTPVLSARTRAVVASIVF